MIYRKIYFAIAVFNLALGYKLPHKRDVQPNPMINEGLFEGDMKGITHETVNALVKRSNNIRLIASSDKSQSGAAIADPFALWPNKELFYEIMNDFNEAEKKIIKDSLEEYHNKTCIKMIPRTDQKDYVTVKKLTGCWSAVGRQGGKQELSLGKGCVDHGVIIHEFMHALGFFHEQSRWDRDLFITIHNETIIPGKENNFNKYDLTMLKDLNTDYDYKSIMHYRKDAFSKNGLDTITPLKPNIVLNIQVSLSDIDVVELQRLYNCGHTGPESLKPISPLTSGIIQSGSRLFGHYTQYFVQNADNCKTKCETDNKCYGMTFDSSHSQSVGNCFLVHSKYEIKPDKPWSSWMKGTIKQRIKFTVKAYSGLHRVKTIETCIQQCQKDPRCQAIMFYDGNYDSDVYGNCFFYEENSDYGTAAEAGQTYSKYTVWFKGEA